jgi:hypothetical protein
MTERYNTLQASNKSHSGHLTQNRRACYNLISIFKAGIGTDTMLEELESRYAAYRDRLNLMKDQYQEMMELLPEHKDAVMETISKHYTA